MRTTLAMATATHVQVKAVKVASSSKFGLALVVETSLASGGYVLGFKLEPRETLDYVHKELSSLLQVGVARVFVCEGGGRGGVTVARAVSADTAASVSGTTT
jgi:hypothetical protein